MSGSLIWNNDDYRKEPAMTAPTDAPFPNCQFKHCDLPGQCVGEGKCHHPKPDAPQESKTPRTDEARISAYGEFGIEGQAFTAVPVDVARQLETELAERTKELAEANGRAEYWKAEHLAGNKVIEQAESTLAKRDAEGERLRELAAGVTMWLRAALDCKHWDWDGDQREIAETMCKEAEAALTRKDG